MTENSDDRESESKDFDRAGRAVELADPDVGASKLDRVINKTAEAFGASLLIIVFLIVFVNASGRYMVGRSLPWGEEVVLGLIPWISMAGLFLSVRRRGLITITYFSEGLPSSVRSLISVSGQILCCSIFGLIAYLGLNHVLTFGGDRTPVLGTPKGLTYAAMMVGAACVAAAFFAQFVISLKENYTKKDR